MRPISYRIGYQGETKILTPVEIHPQMSNNNIHPVDGALVGGAGSFVATISSIRFLIFTPLWYQFHPECGTLGLGF
jgi:hypothetical protein